MWNTSAPEKQSNERTAKDPTVILEWLQWNQIDQMNEAASL